MKALHMVTFLLVLIGALNWGLVGFFDFNLVAFIFGESALIGRIIYILVGLSAVYELITHPASCKLCSKK